MSIELTTVLMFISMLVLAFMGLPIGFALAGIGLIFGFVLWGPESAFTLAPIIFSKSTNFILIAIPLFVFMANMLERSDVAEKLYKAIHIWTGALRGGLAIATVGVCTVIAALSGLSATGTVTMGLIALPEMLKRKYDKGIAIGCIMAGGALGTLIPPSTDLIVFGAFASVSVGRLFAGAILPGLILATLFIVYIAIRCHFSPELGPPLPREERATITWSQRFKSLQGLVLPLLLIASVLGIIFSGVATPSEAAAVGAFGSVICAVASRKFGLQILKEVCYRSLRLTCLMMWIVFGASIFVSVYTALGAPELIHDFVSVLPVNRWLIMVMMQVVIIGLGMLLEPIGILMLTIPVFIPIIKDLGFDPIWFGVLFIVNLEMSYLTPPVGMNLFYMKGIVPQGITMGDIYRSAIPFVGVQIVGLALCMLFPQIILWLPNQLFD